MKFRNKQIIKMATGILVLLLASSGFAEIVFSDGSLSKTFPTVTLKKKTIKFFRKRYERKWTMDTYARLTATSVGTKVNGRTTIKSSFHLLGFTGGVFLDVKDSRGNLIYRLSARTNKEASGYENGKDVGWGVNPNRSRVKSWEVIIPPEISLIGKTLDIYQIRTKKKLDWNKAKTKFNEIAKNLGKAIKDFFDNHGDDAIILAVKYGPKINEMNEAAKAGNLHFSEVCNVMSSILADAKTYGIVQSAKAENLINIIGAVQEIVLNGKEGWAPKNQKMIVALIQDIVIAVNEKNIDDTTLNRIVNNFEAFLNDKSGLVGKNLQPIEVVLINTRDLFKEKLDAQQLEIFNTVIGFVSKINDYEQSPLLQQKKLNCIFAAARAVIDIRSKAINGTLTPDLIHKKLVAFLDVNYLVLGLTLAQNDAIENIIGATVNIVNNSGDGFLPKNQQELVNLIISVERIAASKPLNYDLINIFINDLEKLCSNKGGFAPSSLLDVEIILTNTHALIDPKLKEDSKVKEVFITTIEIVSSINSWGETPVANNTGLIFNGLRLAVDLLEQAVNKTITPEYAEIQINNWYIELEPILKEVYPDKTDQIDAIKEIIDNTFAIIKNGQEGWNFAHWNAIVGIVKAGFEAVQNENQFVVMYTLIELKNDFEILLEDNGSFVVSNGQYIENIIEGFNVLFADNSKVNDTLNKLINYLKDYNSWENTNITSLF